MWRTLVAGLALLVWFSGTRAVGAQNEEKRVTANAEGGKQSGATATAQTKEQAASRQQATGGEAGGAQATITVRTNLVLVPALVKTLDGEVVFSLKADDFTLTDNGVPQTLRLETDTDTQPLAVAVIVETGGLGADHLRDYRDLGGILDAVIGNVPHHVAVIEFDSTPRLALDFTDNTDAAAETISELQAGDEGASILDALNFGINLLRKQPPEYRRAIILCSETIDRESATSFEDAIRAVDDTNTAIYSFAFSSTRAAVGHEAAKLPVPGGNVYTDTPYGPGGCMGKDSDPDAHGKRAVQALDCASDLLPPLRLARMAFLAAKDGFRRNVPESVANLTGGEYFAFKNEGTLQRRLIGISNDVHNYYVLSFRPQAPTTGFHALELSVKGRPDLAVESRKAYWVEEDAEKKDK
jgi:VWFA-related protein